MRAAGRSILTVQLPPHWRRKGHIMQRVRKMRGSTLVLAAAIVLSLAARPFAGTEENGEDFMDLHKVEIAFHEAGSTKNLDLMLSLFADDAVLIAHVKTATGEDQVKTYTGKEQVKKILASGGTISTGKRMGGLHAGIPHSLRRRRRTRASLFRMPVGRQESRQDCSAYQFGRYAGARQRPMADQRNEGCLRAETLAAHLNLSHWQ